MPPLDSKQVAELLEPLVRISEEREALDLREQDAVLQARRDGFSWRTIGTILNITGEGARYRHGKLES